MLAISVKERSQLLLDQMRVKPGNSTMQLRLELMLATMVKEHNQLRLEILRVKPVRMIMPLQLIVDLFKYLYDEATRTETALEKGSRENTERFNKRMAEIKAERDEQGLLG
jgi:hypothetical protein